MAFENNTGIGVHNWYGPRTSTAARGSMKTFGAVQEMVIDFTGDSLLHPELVEASKLVIPAGALVVDAVLDVDTAFNVGGKAVSVGTVGSEATNGIALTPLTKGTVVLTTKKGTWGAKLAADTEVAIKVADTAGVTAEGSGRVVVRYILV